MEPLDLEFIIAILLRQLIKTNNYKKSHLVSLV